ncbi:MAG: replication-associated recombination protein A [Myxococcota bacterium]|nr:replication-associated recombination protein A [Myxococcota bacterium]
MSVSKYSGGKTGDLFAAAARNNLDTQPLAERLRPRTLEEIVGQSKLLHRGSTLRRLIERGRLPSMILWGPPGSGKTTLARVLANHVEASFETMSAVMAGVKDIRAIVAKSEERLHYQNKRTLLFIDEIHRFNKSQQDALLPHVESGLLTLVGATTENPSFEVNSALLSRTRIFVLESLDEDALTDVLERALRDTERGLGESGINASREVLAYIGRCSHGDARHALGSLEICVQLAQQGEQTEIDQALVEDSVQHKALLYDKAGDEHYNVVSAFIKSMRGSDPDASVYWLVRMLEAGEDPRFVLRRMVIFASEDIGNADPTALQVVTDALRAFEFVGLPEGVLPLTQATTYLACAPKSNSVLKAYGAARKDIAEQGPLPVPKKLRNAATGMMKQMGYGKTYKYPHQFDGNYTPDTYLPDELEGRRYYVPSDQGNELGIQERLTQWRAQGSPLNAGNDPN